MATERINIRDINPLEHLTSDLAKARFNYESMLNGIVEWNSSKLKDVTVRLMCDTEPGFVDYTFPTKASSEYTGPNAADPDGWKGAFSYEQRAKISAIVSEESQYNDIVNIRTTVMDGAGANWSLYANAVLYDENFDIEVLAHESESSEGAIDHESEEPVSNTGNILVTDNVIASNDYYKGQFVRVKVGNSGFNKIIWVTAKIEKGDAFTDANSTNVFEQWDSGHYSKYTSEDAPQYLYVIYGDKVYRPAGSISHSVTPDVPGSGWEYFCDAITDGASFSNIHGQAYVYIPNGNYEYAEMFIYTGSDIISGIPPYTVNDGSRYSNPGWTEKSVILIPISGFADTTAIRWHVTTDIESILLRRESDGRVEITPDIRIVPTLKVVGANTVDNGGLAIFDTANYAEWPSTTPIWRNGYTYVTNTGIDATGKQNYSAQMVFDHADPQCKQCNIINYDGPDLDQGLCIYLPVESVLDGEVVYPNDGRTFEFLFRIWPNPAYNGHESADLIINKAQIYVYSIADRTSIQCHGMPIAKFSMARLTNFYVFSENIAVPNRPVLYKAKFVYSALEKRWKTYDYYQIPDCIFLSPSGFVDPSDRSGNAYGVETAGFPLVQDPFSGYDMSPVLVDETYRNRIG